MNDFVQSNKSTGVHWLKGPLENIEIKIILKPQDGVISLPKFEDYANESQSVNLQLHNKLEEHIFKWQQKVFSAWELHRYADVHNCITDTELSYHDTIKNLNLESSKIFTYIHDDYYLPLPAEKKKRNDIRNLNACFEKLKLNEKVGRFVGDETSSMGRLFRSEENLDVEEQWMAMHIVFDNSKYNEDFHLLLKQETTLLSIYHNMSHNYVIVTPDTNHMELNPYSVESELGVPWGYQYGVQVVLEELVGGEELMMLLRKLHKKWSKKQKLLLNFVMPSLGMKHYFLTLEILHAEGFEGDHLYLEFDVKVPDGMESDHVHGRTHSATPLSTDEGVRWNYGHLVEITLKMPAELEPPPLKLFVEAISTDWWGRHRTEGYSYLALPLEPGRYEKQLSCSRPEETDIVAAYSRRFFVGGCHLIKDLDVLARPQVQDTNFTYTSTGNIHIRYTIIKQLHIAGIVAKASRTAHSSASALLHSAEAVLKQYKRARDRLAAVTKDLDVKYQGIADTGL